jgi:hypothetical protein
MTSENKVLLKRLLVALATVLIVGVVFVSPCVHQHQAPATVHDCDADACNLPAGANPAPAVPVTKLITEGNWQFTLPGEDWAPQNLQDPSIKVALMGYEPEHPILILFIREDEEPDTTFQSFVIDSIRTFDMMEFTIDSIKQVVIGDNKYILLQVNRGDKVIWNWMTFKNGVGYNLACGAEINPDAGVSQHDLCFSIADTLKIQ